jgi:hypothetical protein
VQIAQLLHALPERRLRVPAWRALSLRRIYPGERLPARIHVVPHIARTAPPAVDHPAIVAAIASTRIAIPVQLPHLRILAPASAAILLPAAAATRLLLSSLLPAALPALPALAIRRLTLALPRLLAVLTPLAILSRLLSLTLLLARLSIP